MNYKLDKNNIINFMRLNHKIIRKIINEEVEQIKWKWNEL